MSPWLFVAIAACAEPRPALVGPPASATTSPLPAEASVAAPPPVPAGPDVATLRVGLADLRPVAREAIHDNDAAVALLGRSRYDDAVEGFSRAIATAPNFLLARYNLACARARQRHFAEAAATLRELFVADWIGFRVQAHADADLAELWTSPDGAELSKFEGTLEAPYRDAIARGLRALYWVSDSTLGPGNHPFRSWQIVAAERPSVLRVGVYDAEQGAFVATTARQRDVIFAYATPELGYSIVVSGSIPDEIGDLSPLSALARVTFYPYDTSGVPLATLVPGHSEAASLELDDDVAILDLNDFMTPYGKTPSGHPLFAKRLTFQPGRPPTTTLTENPGPRRSTPHFQAHIGLPSSIGFEIESHARGVTYRNRSLTYDDGTTYAIPASMAPNGARATLVDAPGKTMTVMVLDAHFCAASCDSGWTGGRHRIVAVDCRTGAAKVLMEGTGVGAARFDPAGHLYLQHDRQTVRWDDSGPVPLPEGILLVPPLIPEPLIQCCGFPP